MVNPSWEKFFAISSELHHLQALVSYSKFCNIRLSRTRNNQSVGGVDMVHTPNFEEQQQIFNDKSVNSMVSKEAPQLFGPGDCLVYPLGLWAMAVSKPPHIHAHMVEEHYLLSKQFPFLFLCVFWGISPSRRNPRPLSQASSPNCTCSHVPMEIYFFSTKWKRSQEITKRAIYAFVLSWGLGTPSDALLLGEHTCMGTSLTTISLWKLQLSEILEGDITWIYPHFQEPNRA